MIRAQWICSEAGLQSLNVVGLTTGWLRGWLCSEGATDVSFHLLEEGRWRHDEVEWRILYGDVADLVEAAKILGIEADIDPFGQLTIPQGSKFFLKNPCRTCWAITQELDYKIVFISCGDIISERKYYFNIVSGEELQLPLAIYPDDLGEFKLEPGVSGSLLLKGESVRDGALNCDGILPEEQAVELLRKSGLSLRTVESCTAGAIAARVGRIPGVSDVLDRAWVTYHNSAKSEEIGVPATTLEKFGAVSCEVVSAMAEGGRSGDAVCIAVSGIAGPDGGSDAKPVGTVWIAVALPGEKVEVKLLQLSGCRSEIQQRTASAALAFLIERLKVFNA